LTILGRWQRRVVRLEKGIVEKTPGFKILKPEEQRSKPISSGETMRTTAKSKSSKRISKKAFSTDPTGIAVKAASIEVSREERHQLIAQAAYFRAQQRNFAPGYEIEDWLSAEAEVEMKLSQTGINTPSENA
jgi:hypothetical protein